MDELLSMTRKLNESNAGWQSSTLAPILEVGWINILCFTNWGQRAKKTFLGDCLPHPPLTWMTGPPRYPKVWIQHCRHLVSSPEVLSLSYRARLFKDWIALSNVWTTGAKRLVAGREIKLGTICEISMKMLSGKLSKIVILKNPAFTKCWFNTVA